MAVGYRHIQELHDVITDYVTSEQIPSLLTDLTKTEAYRTNSSFRETIDRLMALRIRLYGKRIV